MVRITGIFMMLMVMGCTALERQDIYSDVATGLPKVAEDAATGGPVGAIVGGVSLLATVALGYFVRKFIQKKYAQPKV